EKNKVEACCISTPNFWRQYVTLESLTFLYLALMKEHKLNGAYLHCNIHPQNLASQALARIFHMKPQRNILNSFGKPRTVWGGCLPADTCGDQWRGNLDISYLSMTVLLSTTK